MLKLIILTLFLTISHALYQPDSTVIMLTPTNFDKQVLTGDEIWIVEFFAPWCRHCQALVEEYNKAAVVLKGIVKVGAIDADAYKDLAARYGVQGFPTIKFFGKNKNQPESYGGARTAEALAEAAVKAIKAKIKFILNGGSSKSKNETVNDVIELTDDNFESTVLQSNELWLVEFFAPWCGHCKNLAPHWAKAAKELKGKLKLGALDVTVHRVQAIKYEIESFPTIKFFPPGGKVVDYDGGRTSSDIVSWALEKFYENMPSPEIAQITDQNSFNNTCGSKFLCIVAFLPHILDCNAKCRIKYLNILEGLGEKYKTKMWGWVWSEAGAQHELESGLNVGGFGYPTMVVINIRKLKYSILRGSFSKDGITQFFKDISNGRGNTFPLQAIPNIIHIDSWNGKDGDLPQEEEIDLSDVDLDEKDEL